MENNSQEEILRRFAVEDESWILFDTPQTKQQNKAWVDPKKPRLQVVRPFLTNKKAMILFAFTGDGKVCILAVSPGMTINSEVYIDFFKTIGNRWRMLRSSPTKFQTL